MDRVARMYAQVYDMPIIVTRCANIFGGGDLHFSRIVPGTIQAILDNEPVHLRSDGMYLRDYIFVKDAVGAYLDCVVGLDNGLRGEAFNFGNNAPLKVIELVRVIARLMGKVDLVPIIENTAQHEIRDQYLDSNKAREKLGWTPQYTVEKALLETIAWYTKHLDRPEHESRES